VLRYCDDKKRRGPLFEIALPVRSKKRKKILKIHRYKVQKVHELNSVRRTNETLFKKGLIASFAGR
jgi:hypothetical protein